jgi:hypothetical protein
MRELLLQNPHLLMILISCEILFVLPFIERLSEWSPASAKKSRK